MCTNGAGNYTCTCFEGFAGNGLTCTPTPVLAAVVAAYATPGAGKVACREGQDVKYPHVAPGWAYDEVDGWDNAKDSPWKVSWLEMGCTRSGGMQWLIL